jgi:hypothetical protein
MGKLTLLLERWRGRRERQAVLRALVHMGPTQASALAADVGLAGSDLGRILRSAGQTALLLHRTLRLRGLQAATLSPRTMRELEVTCSLCARSSRCRRELDAGTAVVNAGAFCPNAPTLDALALK